MISARFFAALSLLFLCMETSSICGLAKLVPVMVANPCDKSCSSETANARGDPRRASEAINPLNQSVRRTRDQVPFVRRTYLGAGLLSRELRRFCWRHARGREMLQRIELPPPESSRRRVAAILRQWATPDLDSFVRV